MYRQKVNLLLYWQSSIHHPSIHLSVTHPTIHHPFIYAFIYQSILSFSRFSLGYRGHGGQLELLPAGWRVAPWTSVPPTVTSKCSRWTYQSRTHWIIKTRSTRSSSKHVKEVNHQVLPHWGPSTPPIVTARVGVKTREDKEQDQTRIRSSLEDYPDTAEQQLCFVKLKSMN